MKLTLILVLVLCVCSTQAWFYKPSLQGEKYQTQSAFAKRIQIQNNIDKNSSKPASISLIKLATLFIQDNNRAFDTIGDEMPVQGIFPVKGKRDKLIHSAGLIAQCKFETTSDSPYTGIFKGTDNAFVRFSLAAKATEDAVTPGFVFKFLRDGIPSANIFSMYQLGGQTDSSNIFEHDMSSHVPMINKDADLPLKLLAKNFEKTSDYPTMLGLSNAASFDQSGKQEQSVNFPFRLVFHPSKEAHESMGSNLKITEFYFADALKGKQFETLFDVYAQESPENTELNLIGKINMTSAFQTSEYADQTLYFQHQRFEEDLQLRPQWKKGAEAIIDQQENTFPQFHHEDIGY